MVNYPDLNIAIFGHAKHGKSTLAGRLLLEFGAIDSTKLLKLKQKAKAKGKDYNAYNLAFLERRQDTFYKGGSVFDDNSRTVFPERGKIKLRNGREITIIDTPGYSRFLNNIIYSAHLSDLAILSIEANAGIEEGTLIVTRILKAFKVPIIGIAITKMDKVNYSELRYNEISNEIKTRLKDIFTNQNRIPPIIPLSALSEEGIIQNKMLHWYKKKNILELIIASKSVKENSNEKRVNFVVGGSNEIYSIKGIGTVAVGTLETGVLKDDFKLVLEPYSRIKNKILEYNIKSLRYAKSINEKENSQNEKTVYARSIVSVAIPELDYKEAKKYFRRGGIFGLKEFRPKVATQIESEIIFFEPDTLYEGKEYVLFSNASYSICKIANLPNREIFVRNRKKNKNLTPTTKVMINSPHKTILNLKYPICIEDDPTFKKLTKFVLKQGNNIMGCGRCLRIIK